nr:hypothetical protein [uncultured Rhodopila sp.]
MRPVRLARIAAEAEGVRLRGLATRIATRMVLAVVALVFVIGAIVFAHVAAWYEIRTGLDQTFLVTTGIMAGADLLVAIIFGLLASRSRPGRVEREALDVRRQAIRGISGTLSVTQLLIPALRLMANMRRARRRR